MHIEASIKSSSNFDDAASTDNLPGNILNDPLGIGTEEHGMPSQPHFPGTISASIPDGIRPITSGCPRPRCSRKIRQ
jgi:hypothetical protein